MSAFKRFLKSDITTTPYVANKRWVFEPGNLESNGIYVYTGQKQSGIFDPINDSTENGEYQRLIFDNINHLYYQEFSGSYLDSISLQRTILYESTSIYRPSGSYYHYFPKYDFQKSFPTGSNSEIKVISIPKNIFGLAIKPGTFTGSNDLITLNEDGKGNVFYSSSLFAGNIFYDHGFIVITEPSASSIVDSNLRLEFNNNHIIFERRFKCTAKDYEYNYSYNKSLLLSGSVTELKSFATASYFSPYITTVGLYNDSNELLAVAKFSKPLPTSIKTDFNIIIKLDF